ncbi:hypothetical protein Fcan01_26977 [Folsomia candida]|uniref:Uncharacterized protein n=1 Tax=Folsomia candida TaxID=158441 RepID=A0A226CY31_FOLCA|nr:hypothetical protein Fcan01_26977 [Folsomia candida]
MKTNSDSHFVVLVNGIHFIDVAYPCYRYLLERLVSSPVFFVRLQAIPQLPTPLLDSAFEFVSLHHQCIHCVYPHHLPTTYNFLTNTFSHFDATSLWAHRLDRNAVAVSEVQVGSFKSWKSIILAATKLQFFTVINPLHILYKDVILGLILSNYSEGRTGFSDIRIQTLVSKYFLEEKKITGLTVSSDKHIFITCSSSSESTQLRLNFYLTPFDIWVWGGICASIFIIFPIMTKHMGRRENSYVSGILPFLSTLFEVSPSIRDLLKSPGIRWILTMWTIISLIFSSEYKGFLTNEVITPIDNNPPETWGQLLMESSLEVYSVSDGRLLYPTTDFLLPKARSPYEEAICDEISYAVMNKTIKCGLRLWENVKCSYDYEAERNEGCVKRDTSFIKEFGIYTMAASRNR